MKFFRFSYWSKTDKLVIRGSLVKDKPASGSFWIADVALNSRWSPSGSKTNFTDYGIMEEAFYDSRPWLDSDCEDDFYSVNGDFTPSRGNTPCLSRTTSEKISSVSLTEPSPTEKNKKSLLDLLKDSGQNDRSGDGQSTVLNRERGKLKSVQCCLPGLISCRSFSERRKKASPVISVDGKSSI